MPSTHTMLLFALASGTAGHGLARRLGCRTALSRSAGAIYIGLGITAAPAHGGPES